MLTRPSLLASMPGGSGPPPYVASAVALPASASPGDYNYISAVSTVADSPNMTLSMWLNVAGVAAFPSQWQSNVGTNAQSFSQVGFNFSTDYGLEFRDTTDILEFDGGSDDGVITIGSWAHIFWSADMNYAAGLKVCNLYVNGVNVFDPANTDDNHPAFSIGIFGKTFIVGDLPFGSISLQEQDLADVQIWVGQTIDPSVPGNIEKFISSGKPVDPAIAAAAFGQQTYLFSGDYLHFPINQGSSADTFAVTGTLTNASTSPSD